MSRPLAYLVSSSPISAKDEQPGPHEGARRRTSFSNTHWFSLRSADRQFQSCWLWFSRHCQWVRNCVRQFSLMSLMLSHVSAARSCYRCRCSTHTLAAHLVTLRPSFMHSNSPRPLASVLHIM